MVKRVRVRVREKERKGKSGRKRVGVRDGGVSRNMAVTSVVFGDL